MTTAPPYAPPYDEADDAPDAPPADVEGLRARLAARAGDPDASLAAELLGVYRSSLAWMATHDLSTVAGARRAQLVAATAWREGKAPPLPPGVVRGRPA